MSGSVRLNERAGGMNILWAPWREAYVVRSSGNKKKKNCVFCAIIKEKKDRKNYIFLRSSTCFAVLNIYPFNGGHSLVIPNRHISDLTEMTQEERTDFLDTLVRVKDILQKAFSPQAFNVGLNLGHLAGAGIPEHLHMHVVPRWSGDMNFMPVLFDVKVMPVSLRKVYEAVVNAQKS